MDRMGDDEEMMSGREEMMTARALLSDREKKSGSRHAKTAKKSAPAESLNDSDFLKSESSKVRGSSHLSGSQKYKDAKQYEGLKGDKKAEYRQQLIDQIEELKNKKEKFSFKLIERKQ